MLKRILEFQTILLLVVMISACAPATKPVPPPEVVTQEKPVIEPEPEVVIPEVERKRGVIILMSSTALPYRQVAKQLAESLGDESLQLSMSNRPSKNNSLLKDIIASDKQQVVALGLSAAKLVKGIKGKQVIFAQVVNYKDHAMISKTMKGVSALPSPEKLFKDWKAISPRLTSVAIVAGPRLDGFLNRAKRAAARSGLALVVEEVSSDKEFIYKSKNMKLDIQGQWIIPDNRVLSGKALKEVMAYASRRGRQIVVFSPKLLSFGGLMYVQQEPSIIAKTILKRLEDARLTDEVPGEAVVAVMDHRMGINKNILQQLNIKLPTGYRDLIHGE